MIMSVHYSIVLNPPLFVYGVSYNMFRPVLSHLQGNNSYVTWEISVGFTFVLYI
jgi:hypothetical protein